MTDTSIIASERSIARAVISPDKIACSMTPMAGSFNADILAHGVVEEEIVLRHIGDEPVIMRRGNAADVRAAHGDAAILHIPECGDELGDGGFPAAGGADKGVDRTLTEREVYLVQHLRIIIAEADAVQRHSAALYRLRVRRRARELRRCQDIRHL